MTDDRGIAALIAAMKAESDAGKIAGRKWAEQAAIRDLERIYYAAADGYEGGALAVGLNMTLEEVFDCCFGGNPHCEAFAEGFVWGCMEHFEETDDGTFFDDAAAQPSPQQPKQ